jgi:thiamine-monophosphate kinase
MQIKSEWELLKSINDFIKKKGMPSPSGLIESIGDDCAVFQFDKNKVGLITTDISIESIHFRQDLTSLKDIGFKAMMGNISDITAMGGKPKLALISIGIPERFSKKDVLSIYDGLIEAANMAGLNIAGGDTSKSEQLIINIALYGETTKKNLTRRKGAKAGDTIFVTGNTGDSMAGLEILFTGKKEKVKQFHSLVKKHKRPIARFAVVSEILKKFNPTSMIDISDGLLSDLRHICKNSNAGFQLIEEKLPVSDELRHYSSKQKKSYLEYALNSGEEYELLFTSKKIPDHSIKIGKENIFATPIGKIIDKGFYISRDNKQIKIPITGFNHFNKKNGN